MKRKRICMGVLCAVLAVLLCIPLPGYAASDGTKRVKRVDFSTTAELRNCQQSDQPWGSYTVKGSTNTVAAAGCGILATCNALHYATGYFPDPAQLAEWANANNAGYNGDFTEGTILFARFVDTFGGELGFHTVTYDDTEGSQKLPRVRTFINDLDSNELLIRDFLSNGAAMVAYVENHFVAIVDYNAMTDRFLVWDNNAGDTHGGRRAGITHEAGDWFTWEELRGTRRNAAGDDYQFNIEYVVPFLRTEGMQRFNVSRDGLTVGNLRLQKDGACCDFTPVNVRKYAGQSLIFTGAYTSVGRIDGIGYRVNGGRTVFLPDAVTAASEEARDKGSRWCGTAADTVGFRAAVPIGAKDQKYELVVSEDGVERGIWTVLAATKYTGVPEVIGEPESESGESTAPVTVPEDTAVAGTDTAGDETQAGGYETDTAEEQTTTAGPADTPAGGRIRAGYIAAVLLLAAACAVLIPLAVRRTRRRRLILVILALIACACVVWVILTAAGTGHDPGGDVVSDTEAAAPETAEPTQTEEPAQTEEITQAEVETTDPYAEAAALIEAESYEEALSVLSGLPDDMNVRNMAAECEMQLLRGAEVGSMIRFGFYEQDNNEENGKEMIKWRVLAKDGNRLLVISDKGLDCKPYNETFWSMTWDRCTLRTWLNHSFFDEAFSESEQAVVMKTKVTPDKNPDYATAPGSMTNDRVFLLSIPEAERYLPSVKDRKCEPTAYAVAHGAWASAPLDGSRDSTGTTPACYWWLRTPGSTVFDAAFVHYRGSVLRGGRRVNSVSSVCVRPCLWLKLPNE